MRERWKFLMKKLRKKIRAIYKGYPEENVISNISKKR